MSLMLREEGEQEEHNQVEQEQQAQQEPMGQQAREEEGEEQQAQPLPALVVLEEHLPQVEGVEVQFSMDRIRELVEPALEASASP